MLLRGYGHVPKGGLEGRIENAMYFGVVRRLGTFDYGLLMASTFAKFLKMKHFDFCTKVTKKFYGSLFI